jgi:alkyl hydroperoxide reductase subunit D
MSALDALREKLPETAKDIRLNLQAVLDADTLTTAQKWGVAVAAAVASREPRLRDAVLEDARAQAGAELVDDAQAAAVLMGMNNVYYRFRHIVGKESYSHRPARLRMNRLVRPQTNRPDFELFSLAVSAINGCESCVRSHEAAVLESGLSEDGIHDAVRIASVIHAAAVALSS